MRTDKAVELFRSGYNCSQAVLGAFEDLGKLDEKTLLSTGSALGGGFARSRNLCGAVNAMGIIYGLYSGDTDKNNAYFVVNQMIQEFLQLHSDINCGVLLKNVNTIPGIVAEKRSSEYYAKRPCERIVWDCVMILKKHLGLKEEED